MAAPVFAYLGYLQSAGFWAADACLDRGGSYHYDRHGCSFDESHRGEVPSLWPF
ncbi:hypothetical protein AAG602_13250 [Citromicrobium bathyomarinum]